MSGLLICGGLALPREILAIDPTLQRSTALARHPIDTRKLQRIVRSALEAFPFDASSQQCDLRPDEKKRKQVQCTRRAGLIMSSGGAAATLAAARQWTNPGDKGGRLESICVIAVCLLGAIYSCFKAVNVPSPEHNRHSEHAEVVDRINAQGVPAPLHMNPGPAPEQAFKPVCIFCRIIESQRDTQIPTTKTEWERAVLYQSILAARREMLETEEGLCDTIVSCDIDNLADHLMKGLSGP